MYHNNNLYNYLLILVIDIHRNKYLSNMTILTYIFKQIFKEQTKQNT